MGGGDGGTVREVLKHKCVESVHLCEIDEVQNHIGWPLAITHLLYGLFVYVQKVIEVSKKYLPHLTSGLSDPRLQIHIQDGMEFIDAHHNEFDVIIIDTSDPMGRSCL